MQQQQQFLHSAASDRRWGRRREVTNGNRSG